MSSNLHIDTVMRDRSNNFGQICWIYLHIGNNGKSFLLQEDSYQFEDSSDLLQITSRQGKEKFNDFLYNAAYVIFHIFDSYSLLVIWLTYLWNFYSDEILDILILIVDIIFLFTIQ